ncbi:hypothetical protein R4Z09_15905 [Niallia oryzisoli]|uniref:Uncharacterized protein n=1 Tax=Niallia oryzisoli TaxID=1737571 RepID=A0ABZ2C993_9BACI
MVTIVKDPNTKLNMRERIINEIIHLIYVLDINELPGWEDIDFFHIESLRNNAVISTEELFVLQDLLNNKYEEMLYQMYLEKFYLQ